MPQSLMELIEKAKAVTMTTADRERQRRSFAYGNSKIENDRITRRSIDEAAKELAGNPNGKKD